MELGQQRDSEDHAEETHLEDKVDEQRDEHHSVEGARSSVAEA